MQLKVGELARSTGLTVRTLHHYDEIGLLKPSDRSESGYRLYSQQDVARLHAIQAMRHLGLALFLCNRAADGLDGALARQRGATDRGGYIDIVLDFIIYGLMALGFAIRDPAMAALPAAFLLASFMGTGSSFLAYAILAGKHGRSTALRGAKSFYHLGGLTEGTETIIFFLLCLAEPGWFPLLAWIFGALCWLTTLGRVIAGWRDFS